MASVVKHFVARHGVAVGTSPTTVISDTGAATFTNLSVSGSLQTALNLNSQILTNANIDSGTIDGATIATSNITVGSTKTLDVSAGTLTLANDQISGDKIHGGTISGPVTISAPYIATIYSQAATGGVLTLRSNAADVTTGYVSVPMTTVSTTVGTGALVVAGGLGVTGQSTLSNVVITGSLTVNGSTTTVNSTTVTIDDPIFTLGGDETPAADDNKDRGIEFKWHTGAAARVGFFGFDDSTGKFTFIPDATNTSEVFSGTKGTLDAFLSASDLSGGTIASAILGNSTVYVGTTAIALNRATAAQSLTGITSIDGSAATLTTNRAINGVNFNGSADITVPVNVTQDNATNATYYPIFAIAATTGNQSAKVSSTKLTFNPSTGALTATSFVGPLTGNATTATTLQTTRAINGVNFDGSAAITVPVNSADDTTTAATYYPLWTTAAGNTAAKISTTKLTFNPSTGVLTATGFSGNGASLTSLTAGNLSGTIPTGVLGNSTLYVGTTAISLNRGSASQALTGITSIDGSAATLTTARAINGVNFDGSAAITVPVNVTDDTTTAATYYPTFAVGSSGDQALKVSSTKLKYYPITGILDAVGFAGSASGLTGLPAGQLTGTIPTGVLGNSTVYVGTTAIALNRATAAQALTGIDTITSDATTATVFNTVATTVNAFGAATTISVGSTGATITTFNGTAAVTLPNGDDAARPGTPVVGMIRYSTTAGKFEGYTSGGWGGIGGGSTITDDTSTSATYYPSFVTATSGTADILKVSSTKLQFDPSTGTLKSTIFQSLSDEKVKDNVVSIENATDTINKLRGVSFTWKDNGNTSYGVIAQELEQVLPALVSGEDIKTVNYDGLIAFLLKAVQEMDARIKELESK